MQDRKRHFLIDELLFETGLTPELIGEDIGIEYVLSRGSRVGEVVTFFQRRPGDAGPRPVIIGSVTVAEACRILKESVTISFIRRLDAIKGRMTVAMVPTWIGEPLYPYTLHMVVSGYIAKGEI